MKKRTLILAFATVTSVASAQLYSQNPHTPGAAGGNGMSAVQGNLTGVAGDFWDRQVADDFVVTGAGWSINRVVSNWAIGTVGNTTPITAINFAFFGSVGGAPGALLATRTVAAFSDTVGPGTYFGRPERIFDASFAPVVLGPGSHFVMIQPVVNHNYFWLTSSPTTPIAGSPAHFRKGPLTAGAADPTWPTTFTASGTAGSAFTTAQDLAFKLHGTVVPEPFTIGTLGLGVAMLLRRRRKA